MNSIINLLKETIVKNSDCMGRNYASFLTNGEVYFVGYTHHNLNNGCMSCKQKGYCERQRQGCKSGFGYHLCPSEAVHSERHSISLAKEQGFDDLSDFSITVVGLNSNGTLCKGLPCIHCAKAILTSGIKWVNVVNEDGTTTTFDSFDLVSYLLKKEV